MKSSSENFDRDVASGSKPVTGVGNASSGPTRIGRYRVERMLGKGGFGLVYLAFDDQLRRQIAIKVPNSELIAHVTDVELYLSEARMLANLEHPHIVPVFDVGSTDEFPCYVVSKFIDGSDLATRIRKSRVGLREAAELIATVAEALHHAHERNLVHRDIKPANILLDQDGKPYVADFGLAIQELDFGTAPRNAGTPAYMSPEQARGEGHRVKRTSDVFSLGVVFYELLVGRRPFEAESPKDLLNEISTRDPRPPHYVDNSIPKDLDRICLKALMKKASERYSTAEKMAEELRAWLSTSPSAEEPPIAGSLSGTNPGSEAVRNASELFLCYATSDQESAKKLCGSLHDRKFMGRLSDQGVPHGTGSVKPDNRDSLQSSSAVVLIISRYSNDSVRVIEEMEEALRLGKRTFAVFLEDIRLSAALEPMVADARRIEAWSISLDRVAAQIAQELQATLDTHGAGGSSTRHLSEVPLKIVPKGLRSFDAGDAEFFLELLPGPQDREGLPDSLRFWKTRIESRDADVAFSVGLVFGPSGCGKSSLMKAGLLPRLAPFVKAIFVEATTKETELRLLRSLRRLFSEIPMDLPLTEVLADLRRGLYAKPGQKVLLIIDQFEQWLSANRNEENTELVQALRQCDGERVQCLLMVRDDFGMAATRFMRALDVPIEQGKNFATVDLFDLRHARKVLAAFGRAYECLPDNLGQCSKDQLAFLEQCVLGLARDDKVVSVRLSLFAEMIKGKPWIPATLKQIGGTEGVGQMFLEETFVASTAPPPHRRHQKAAQAVLKSLLPEAGSNIKGHMRSYHELLKASGYTNRPKDFEELLHILDAELRLITPTDPEGTEDTIPADVDDEDKYYQLTHDYLVPSLRHWLSRKQRETPRGRAELMLEERATHWIAKPETRQLPSFWQWLQIVRFTQIANRTPTERKLVRASNRYHLIRLGIGLALVLMIGAVAQFIHEHETGQRNAREAVALVHRLVDSDEAQIPTIIAELQPYRHWADPLLRSEIDKLVRSGNANASDKSAKRLRISLALLPVDPSQVDYLYERLLDSDPKEFLVIRDALKEFKDNVVPRLWPVVESQEKKKQGHRLRAAAALANYDPGNDKWEAVQEAVVNEMVAVPAVFASIWMEELRHVRLKLVPRLTAVFSNPAGRETERSLATEFLADYASDQPRILVDLLLGADEQQFDVIFPKFEAKLGDCQFLVMNELAKRLPDDSPDTLIEMLSKRQANAAVTLYRIGPADIVWPLLNIRPDARLRSYLIYRLPLLVDDASPVVDQFVQESNIAIRRALVQILGDFNGDQLSHDQQSSLLPKLKDLYRHSSDAGLHASIEWLFGQWQQSNPSLAVNNWTLACNEEWASERIKREELIKASFLKQADKATPQWFVTSQRQTMVVIPGPVTFVMGSPLTELGRQEDELQHQERIGRTFAVSSKPVTVEEFSRFDKETEPSESTASDRQRPVVHVSWHKAASYCNWLSEQDGIPTDQHCYVIEGEKAEAKPHFLHLEGYRLPIEAEIEYVTRGGSTTGRFYGETDELLPQYAWFLRSAGYSAHDVGTLKPNEFGFFDVHGNVAIWCQDHFQKYEATGIHETSDEVIEPSKSESTDARVVRGGSFNDHSMLVRSAYRNYIETDDEETYIGFRIARTIHR